MPEGAVSEDSIRGFALFRPTLIGLGFGFAKQKAKIYLVQGSMLSVMN